MVPTLTMRASVPDHVLCQQLEEEAVLLDLETECYFGLDEVGARMWVLATSSATIQEAYDALVQEYEVEPEVLRRDLIELVGELHDAGLVVLEGA